MRTIMVVNAKGGSGKTTVATNLAGYYADRGKKVVIADYDPQGSSLDWLEERPAGKPDIYGIDAANYSFRAQRGTDFVILDTPAGLYGSELGNIVRRAETFLIPITPSPIDMRAAELMLDKLLGLAKYKQKKGKFAFVVNRARTNTVIAEQLTDFLSWYKVPVIAQLRESMNYIRVAESGLSVFEFAPRQTEIDREQWAPLIKWLNSKRSRV